MNLYIMRHGETVWNKQKRTQGRTNNRLSSDGIKACEKIAEDLKNIKFDYIFCSPLCRAIQTANIINKYHNLKIIKDERITDIDQGYFTGKFYDKLTDEEIIAKKNKDEKFKMESSQNFHLRIKNFYNFIKNNYYDKTVLIVTHSGVTSNLQIIINNEKLNEKNFNTYLLKNSEVKLFNI